MVTRFPRPYPMTKSPGKRSRNPILSHTSIPIRRRGHRTVHIIGTRRRADMRTKSAAKRSMTLERGKKNSPQPAQKRDCECVSAGYAAMRSHRRSRRSGMTRSVTQRRQRPVRSPAGKHTRPARAAIIRRMRRSRRSGMIPSTTQGRRRPARRLAGKRTRPARAAIIRRIRQFLRRGTDLFRMRDKTRPVHRAVGWRMRRAKTAIIRPIRLFPRLDIIMSTAHAIAAAPPIRPYRPNPTSNWYTGLTAAVIPSRASGQCPMQFS